MAASACVLVFAGTPVQAVTWPDASIRQLIVSVAPGWDSQRGILVCLERDDGEWRPASPPIEVLYGRNGLAWGRGRRAFETGGPHKTEGDGRTPAGLFAVGRIFGYAPRLPDGSDFPYQQVTEADAWIDDPAHPDYNRHIRVDPADPPPWFEAQRMRLGDDAFRWMIEIRHNADPPIPGDGSAIFMHIRRGPLRPTAGCTAMREEDLLWIIRWLRADKQPHYLLLPEAEYDRFRIDPGLPAIAVPQSVGSQRGRPQAGSNSDPEKNPQKSG